MTQPFLALLPGLDGTGRLFAPLIDALKGDRDRVVIGYPDLDRIEDYVSHVLDRLPGDRPVVLIAESFSGPIALHLLANHPERVTAAVLSTTFARPPLGLVLAAAHKLRFATFVRPALNERILRLFALNGVSDLALIRNTVAVVRPINEATIAGRLRAMAQMGPPPELARIHQPVLVLTAGRDRVVRRRFSASLLEQLPAVTHRTIDGPHLLLQAAPHACAREIDAFLEGVVLTDPAPQSAL